MHRIHNLLALVILQALPTKLISHCATPQAPLNLELSTCLQQCLYSGSCLSVFYDKSDKKCLHIEVFLSESDSSLVEKQGTFYYRQDRAPLEIECASTHGYQLEDSGLCLKQVSSAATWSAARTSCEDDGASLLKIGSREKNSVVKLMLTGMQLLGGNDLATEETYVWNDGTPIQGFTDWDEDQPDHGTNQNCLWISAGGWHDGFCSSSLKYMCEKKMNGTSVR